jgi:serine acetyltransferase
MPGSTIGDNCVIGAGSVVTRSIPPNSVAAGVPAKVIRSTDEYWERLQPRLMHVRSLPYEEKRRRVGSLLPRQP